MDDQLGGVFGPVSSFKTTARTVKTPPISPHSLVTYIIFYPYSLLRQSGSFFSSSPSYMINTNMMNYQRILAGLLLAIGLSIVNSKGIRALQANVPEFSTRIVGGENADAQRFPYAQVSLQDYSGHLCGGTVLAPDVVMTAAHCATRFDKVLVGMYNLNEFTGDVQEFKVQKEYISPRYNEESTSYDVLLVKLDGNITGVDPVRINNNRKRPVVTDVLTVVGWGATLVTDRYVNYPDTLQEVDISYIPNAICRAIVDDNGFSLGLWLSADMMCAADEGKDSCWGDSGGPLLILGSNPSEDVQVGIVSWGLDCAEKIPGVYHRLSHSYRWIQKTMCEISDSPADYFDCSTPAPTLSPVQTEMPTDVSTPSPTQRSPSSSGFHPWLGCAFALLALTPALLF